MKSFSLDRFFEWSWKKRTVAVIIFLLAIKAVVDVSTMSNASTPPVAQPQAVASQPAPASTPASTSQPAKVGTDDISDVVPVSPTIQQNVASVVNTSLQQNSSQFSYKNIKIDTDYSDKAFPRPAGAKMLFIDINTSGDSFWSDNSIITGTGKLASSIFQQVFSIDQNFYEISIRYFATTIDQYGNSKNDMVIQYNMDRPVYSKINWSGFSGTANDIHLCAFLRNEFRSMSQAGQLNSVVGCLINASNLRTAEEAIESSN